MRRLILDTSTIARWTGSPVGIVRVEHELAQHAMRHRPDVVLTFFDPHSGHLREVAPAWRRDLLGLDGSIDTIEVDYRKSRSGWWQLLPGRYKPVMALERYRLTASARNAELATKMQNVLLGRNRLRPPFGDAQGNRYGVIPYRAALGPAQALGPDDTVLSAGSDWLHKGAALLALQRRQGFRLTVMCYDLLPVTHPDFFRSEDVARFRNYWLATLPAAARIVCNSRCIAADVAAFAASHSLTAPPITILPLGYTPSETGTSPPLPKPLRQGRFALFVSTIEPRKGHAVLLEAWRRLRAVGLPQQHDFRLVFVGRTGWMVDDVLCQLYGKQAPFGDSVLHLQGVDDATLARLYRDAAFCLYPSRYEGFGLPIIEAFAHGKAIIASTGGAVPETVAGLSPCLDPLDIASWTSALSDWIAHPEAIAPWEARIARQARHATWPEAAEAIMQAALAIA